MNDQETTQEQLPEPLPVSVLTGFLGSGKTTVLRHLLTQPGGERIAIVINEFGEIGLDHHLLRKIDETTVLLQSGCLCCTVRDDLVSTLRELFFKRRSGEIPEFDRIVVETTGLADPAPIIHTLMRDALLAMAYRLDGVIATVDAVNGSATLDAQMESVKQAAMADRILLTKSDLAPPAAVAALQARLRALNPAAPIIAVRDGVVEPAQLFNAGLYNPETKTLEVRRWLRAEAYDAHAHHDHHHDHGHDHRRHEPTPLDRNRHDERIRAFCVTYDRPLDWNRFADWVEMVILAHGQNLLRMKGILNVEGEDAPVVVHGVQHLFHPPAKMEAWPDADRRSRLVFIVRDAEKIFFERTLASFNEGPVKVAPTPQGASA